MLPKAERALFLLYLLGLLFLWKGSPSFLMIAAIGGGLLCVFYLALFWRMGGVGSRPAWLGLGVLLAASVAASFAQGLDYSSVAYEAPAMALIDLVALAAAWRFARDGATRRGFCARLAVAVVVLAAQCVVAFAGG